MKNTVELEKIKHNLQRLPPEKIAELSSYIENLLTKSSRIKTGNAVKLKGIWTGMGFQKLDVESEVQILRSEIDISVLKK